jgi:sugar phosphate isomerase/epimerase
MKTALSTAAAVSTDPASAETAPNRRLKLGFDNFSIRGLKWKAPELIDYAAAMKVDALLISDLDAFGEHTSSNLKDVGSRARDAGIELHVGTLSICPTSKRFDKKWGTAVEHLRLLVRVARETGSSVARSVLGFAEDRQTPGGIDARINDTVGVLKSVRSEALDSGIRIAVENHAGDMQGRELKRLIEDAGTDFVGATIDSGNATWALESPQNNFDVLHPFIATSGIRDSMIWEFPDGAMVQWTAVGDGLVDWAAYFQAWSAKTPECPVILEIISVFARPFPYLKPEFWRGYENFPAQEFATFLAMAKRGREIPPFKAGPTMTDAQYQREQLEKSLRFSRESLQLGRRA